ncbi:MAG: hypothetical protein LBJ00_18070 [Planctomycetaceae bacterium]|jgi:hypothetical protein|nr:hypothetical protein [Planctomycetaceae bacterium]
MKKSIALYSSCFEIPEAEHASVASRSGCSRAKPIAHTGFGIIVFFILGFACETQAQVDRNYGLGQRPETLQSLAQQFVAPNDEYKPHAWWHWLGSNFSKEGMTKDLQAMKASGIGGVVIFNAPSWLDPEKNPWQHQTYRSAAYWDALKHALAEAKKLNMTVGIHNTAGWSTTGGTWISPEDGMQAITYNKTSITGEKQIKITIPNPKADDAKRSKYFKDVALVAVPVRENVTADEVIDISKYMNENGNLDWQAPKGEWIIYRVGHYPTLTHSHPTPEDVAESCLEADKMNLAVTVKHWQNVLNPLKNQFANYIGTTFKYIWIDSYEAGDQTWSPNFRNDFIRLKGYDPVLQIALADIRGNSLFNPDPRRHGFRNPNEKNANETNIFLRDHAEVVNRLFMSCWQIGKEMVNNAGFVLCWEPYCSWGGGPFNMSEGVAIADIPVTEFWVHSGDVFGGDAIAKAAAANGKRIIGAEAFTGMEATCKFTETPYMLKRSADMGYSYGVNLYFLHSWAHNPFDDKYQPGFNFAHYGTHFSRNQTWLEPAKAFFTYLARCQMLLQQGSFVTRTDKMLHRRTPQAEIFFVRNNEKAQEKTVEFPVANRVPELWDAYSGTIKNTTQWKYADNKTFVTLNLEKDESVFVVFPARKTNYAKVAETKLSDEVTVSIDGEWAVNFKPKTEEKPFQKIFNELADFSKQDDKSVKYFSGTAVYEKVISANENDLSAKKIVTLDLGQLYDIAELEVNGKKAGVLWCPPYKTNITPLLQKGNNTLKIYVTNNWANRLIGDEQYPEDFEWTDKNQGLRAMKSLPEWFVNNQPRPVKERKTFIPWYYFNKNSPLYPAGLLGPVKLRIFNEENGNQE